MIRYDNYYQNYLYSYHHYHDYLKSPKKQIEFKAIFSPAVGGRRNEETTSNMVRRQGRIMAALGDFLSQRNSKWWWSETTRTRNMVRRQRKMIMRASPVWGRSPAYVESESDVRISFCHRFVFVLGPSGSAAFHLGATQFINENLDNAEKTLHFKFWTQTVRWQFWVLELKKLFSLFRCN